MLDSQAHSAILGTIYPQCRIQELTNGGGERRFFQEFIHTTATLVCSSGVRGHAPPEKKI